MNKFWTFYKGTKSCSTVFESSLSVSKICAKVTFDGRKFNSSLGEILPLVFWPLAWNCQRIRKWLWWKNKLFFLVSSLDERRTETLRRTVCQPRKFSKFYDNFFIFFLLFINKKEPISSILNQVTYLFFLENLKSFRVMLTYQIKQNVSRLLFIMRKR